MAKDVSALVTEGVPFSGNPLVVWIGCLGLDLVEGKGESPPRTPPNHPSKPPNRGKLTFKKDTSIHLHFVEVSCQSGLGSKWFHGSISGLGFMSLHFGEKATQKNIATT